MSLYYPTEQNAVTKTLAAQLDEGVTASVTLNNVTSIQNKQGLFVVDRVDTGGNLKSPSVREYIIYQGTSGSTLTTLTRGVAGSTDQDHAVGAVVEFVADITQQQGIIDALLNLVDTDGALDPTKVVDLATAQTLTNKTLTSPVLNTGLSGTAFLDEDNMASNSATKAASQQSIKAYVDAQIATVSTPSSVALTAAPGSDHTSTGVKITLTANENQAFGDVCYINSSGEAQLADADAIATAKVVVMADATIAADASGSYLVMGVARDDTWAWTVGGLIYLTVTGTTGNTLSQTAPSATDDAVVIVGIATHADRMLFNPQLSVVEHV